MAMRTPTTRSVLVSGSDDATVRIWDLGARGLLCARLEAHQGKVNAVAVGDLHGRPIAVSGGNDRTVRVWDLLTGRPRGTPLVGHDRKVLAVAVGKLGGRPIAVSGGIDGTVRLWDLEAGGPLGGPLVHDRFVNAVASGNSATARLKRPAMQSRRRSRWWQLRSPTLAGKLRCPWRLPGWTTAATWAAGRNPPQPGDGGKVAPQRHAARTRTRPSRDGWSLSRSGWCCWALCWWSSPCATW